MKVRGKLIEADWNILQGNLPAQPSSPALPQALANCTGEQAFQESLSRHSEYLPRLANTHHGIWFDWILYKYALPSGNEVDFAYVETTSVQNTIVLIEIEDPAKKMWVGTPQTPHRSKEFNHAIEQVTRWRTDLNDPVQRAALINSFKIAFGGCTLAQNPWDVQYGLIYGRSAENLSDQQKASYADLQRTVGIEIMTFDHLVTRYRNFPEQPRNVVSVSVPGPVFSYLYLNTPPRSDFAYLSPGKLKLDQEAKDVLVSQGYDISAWENGKLLAVNGKAPLSSLSTSILP